MTLTLTLTWREQAALSTDTKLLLARHRTKREGQYRFKAPTAEEIGSAVSSMQQDLIKAQSHDIP